MVAEAPPESPTDEELEALIEEARRRARKRRLGYLAVVAGLGLVGGGLYLALNAGGDGGDLSGTPDARIKTARAPAEELLRRDPFMGVSCRIPNAFACDRVGLAVWLREPATKVDAAIAGREFELDDSDSVWGAPAANDERRMFAGFLRPAGLIAGPLQITPDAGPDRWIGREPVFATVDLRIIRAEGGTATTTVEVRLLPGWG